jgi:hypothetical protein
MRATIRRRPSSGIASRRVCNLTPPIPTPEHWPTTRAQPTTAGFAGENGGSRASSILARYVDFGNVYGTRRHRWNSTMVYDLPVWTWKAVWFFDVAHRRSGRRGLATLKHLPVAVWSIRVIVFPQRPGRPPPGTGSGLTGTNTGFDGGPSQPIPGQGSRA